MSLKKKLSQYKMLRGMYHKFWECFYSFTTVVSPKLNSILRYRTAFGRSPDFNDPKTFSEKLLWLKLNNYIKNPLVIKCADKVSVREYVKEKGYGDTLNEIIGIYNSPNEIPWDELPDQFVLKWNFGAGMNIICEDKQKLDKTVVLDKMQKWGRNKYWLPYAEMQYKYIKKKIICEKFLHDEISSCISDYKVYCFNGEPQAILVIHDRFENVTSEFFDIHWNKLENSPKYNSPSALTPPPSCLENMLSAARSFSKPFPFVRCDFYVVTGKLFFGELTFTPAAGIYTSETLVHGKSMAELLNIEQNKYRRQKNGNV